LPVTVIKLIRAWVPQTHSMRRRRLSEFASSQWGDLLREIRVEQGISQRQLAEMAGVNRNALRRMEKNEGPCAMELLERVGCALGYSFDIYADSKEIVT
jgi:DNA-binding XRE family transcriptional regulator